MPLEKFREELRKLKYVEQDLPDALLPLGSIYRDYWDERTFPSFEVWFETFWAELVNDREKHRVLEQFKADFFSFAHATSPEKEAWFKEGFRARMWRTWSAILTQLDVCYALEALGEVVTAGADLDRSGVDLEVRGVSLQVGKLTARKEARSIQQRVISVPYSIENPVELDRKARNPRARVPAKHAARRDAHKKYFLRLPNGFVVFGDAYVRGIVNHLRNSKELLTFLGEVRLELEGVTRG